MDERWLPVGGYEGLYEVSDLGNVRSWHTGFPKILSPGSTKAGYLHVCLYKTGRQQVVRVHRLVLGAFVGPCPVGEEACHGQGGPADNQLGNLRWGTSRANKLDQVKEGTHVSSRKTQCPYGHKYTPENTVRQPGGRRCRECHLECNRAYYRRKKAL